VSHSVDFKPRPERGFSLGHGWSLRLKPSTFFSARASLPLFAKVVNDAECPANCLGSSRSRSACSFTRSDTVDTLRGYVCDAELFKDHAGAGLL
jgi:hypothetical protein